MEWKTDSDVDDIDDELYSPFTKKKSGGIFERTETPYIVMGGVLLVLIVFFIFFIPATQKNNLEELKSIEARLSAIEQRMGQLEKIKKQTGNVKVQGQGSTINPLEYEQLVNWIKSNGDIISKIITKIDVIQQDIAGLNKKGKTVVTKPKPKLQPQAKIVSKPKPQVKAVSKSKVKPEPTPPLKPEPKPQVKPEAKPKSQVKIAPQKPKAVAETIKMTYHNVKKGETLYRISRKYGTSVKKIQELNNMKNSLLIHPGQELVVRAEKQ